MTAARRWPMCGPPTAAALGHSGGQAAAAEVPSAQAAAAADISVLSTVVAILAARLGDAGIGEEELLSQASPARVVQLLAVMVTTLLGGIFADAGAQLLRDLGEAAVTRNPPAGGG